MSSRTAVSVVHQVVVDTVLHLVDRQLDHRALGGTQESTTSTQGPLSQTATSSSPASTSSMAGNTNGNTSSPLLFFVALGFGVVFTNLWIIVGVKYCFRYNARNRALRDGTYVDPITLDAMPVRPHRRRREKKLMTMEEVNERFPLTKYKAWVASRASEGLPTAGGVAATPSRPVSLRDADGALPASPSDDTKQSMGTRPATANTEEAAASHPLDFGEKKDTEAGTSSDEQNTLEQVKTTTSTVHKQATATSDDDEDDEDDHIHTAVPPELLTNPGDSCAICIDTLEEDDDIRGLTCGHAFHAGCLDPWLTSRRACCPLCKADYYVPKPRPEGEVVDTGRRGHRMPQQPTSAWTGLRSNTRMMLPGRFMSASGYPNEANDTGPGSQRRARRARARDAANAATAAQPAVGGDSGAAQSVGAAPNTTRWNFFRNVHMPNIPGRARPPPAVGTDPSPSQLEAGTIR